MWTTRVSLPKQCKHVKIAARDAGKVGKTKTKQKTPYKTR